MRKLIILLFIATLTACAGVVEVEQSVDFYVEDGDKFFGNKEYTKAIKAYENALIRAETPEFAAEVQLKLADSYFYSKKYGEAIPIYETYIDIYKGTPNELSATLNIGLSHYFLKGNIQRDQSDIEIAKEYFQKIIAIAPDLAIENGLEAKIVDINEQLAKKELIVAKYYKRIDQKQQLLGRLKYLLTKFPDSAVYPEAAFLLVTSTDNETDKENYTILLQMKYPENLYTKKLEK